MALYYVDKIVLLTNQTILSANHLPGTKLLVPEIISTDGAKRGFFLTSQLAKRD
jgi:hypothetical protein